MSAMILEVIACSVADAIEAQRGGADRLEVVRELDRGGLTPPLDVVQAIKKAVALPLRVMVREIEGHGIEQLCTAAAELAKLGVDGLVLGFIKDGEIDLDLTNRVLAAAPGVKATFHHAFEDAADQLKAVSELKKVVAVDRILSHGGWGTLDERRSRLEAYARAATPEIEIIAGGRIDRDAIELLKRTTPIREFHVGRAAREQSGAVNAELVRSLRTIQLRTV